LTPLVFTKSTALSTADLEILSVH